MGEKMIEERNGRKEEESGGWETFFTYSKVLAPALAIPDSEDCMIESRGDCEFNRAA